MPERPTSRGRRRLDIGWNGATPHCPFVTAPIATFANPHPDREDARLRFEASPDGEPLSPSVTRSGDRATCHVPMPAERHAESVLVDGLPVAFAESAVGGSSSVDFRIGLPGPFEITIRCR